MTQPGLFGFTTTPAFDGATFEPARDGDRLRAQLDQVRELMRDGAWHTLAGISLRLGYPEASISARLRDLRKPQFGGYRIDRQYVQRGLWRYRLRVAA